MWYVAPDSHGFDVGDLEVVVFILVDDVDSDQVRHGSVRLAEEIAGHECGHATSQDQELGLVRRDEIAHLLFGLVDDLHDVPFILG